MPIFNGSRHQLESKFKAIYYNSLGEPRTVSWLTLRKPLKVLSYPDNKSVVLSEGDTLQRFSYLIYGDPQYWWVIAEFNQIFDPSLTNQGGELFSGLILTYPSAERLFSELLR